MTPREDEGSNPAAREAAEEWRKRFGREGHEGSYAPHENGEEQVAEPPAAAEAEPSRTS